MIETIITIAKSLWPLWLLIVVYNIVMPFVNRTTKF